MFRGMPAVNICCFHSKFTGKFTSFRDHELRKTELIICVSLCVSDLETSDGHLFFPDWVSVSDQSLFSLPLFHSAGDR